MNVVNLDLIKEALASIDIIPTIETGFVAYSQGKAIVPPVGELLLKNPPGEIHIKYGYLTGEPYYVIKIASGFYDNPQLNLPANNGMMLLFSQKTGALESILLDEGHLTEVRTAAAGAIAARHIGPQSIQRIGIVGTGEQARAQLRFLSQITDCRDVTVWGRQEEKLTLYKEEMETEGYVIDTTMDTSEVAAKCNLIVTVTPSTVPLLTANQIRKGTHITAVGSDTRDKQELDSAILKQADVVVADSIAQCLERGEIARAIQNGDLTATDAMELGDVIAGKVQGRTQDDQITVADLTGVAVQDIQIATMIHEATSL